MDANDTDSFQSAPSLSHNAVLEVVFESIGRNFGFFLFGVDVVLVTGYLVIQGRSDPRWVLSAVVLTLAAEIGLTALHGSSDCRAVMLGPTAYLEALHWEKVLAIPCKALLQFAAQGYFVYRYYSLLRNQTLHQINAVLFTALIVGETTLYLATFPLTLDSRLRHFQETTEFDGTVHMSTAIRDINVAVHILAAIINCGLAVVFAQRMRQMNHEVAPDPAASALFGRAIKVIVACALTSGIATTIGALAIALWFIIANDLKVGLIAEVQPHLYATSLLVALLSREKIRQEVRKNEVAKVSAAMAGVDERLASVSAGSPLAAVANDPLSSLPFAAIDLEKAKGPLTPRSGLLSLTAPPVLGARAGSGGRGQSNDENAGPTPGRSTFHKSSHIRQWSTSLASDHTALGLEGQQTALEQDTKTPIMAAPNAQTLQSRRSASALDSVTAESVKFMPSLLERVEMEQLDDLGLPPARRSSEITAVDPAMASHQPRS